MWAWIFFPSPKVLVSIFFCYRRPQRMALVLQNPFWEALWTLQVCALLTPTLLNLKEAGEGNGFCERLRGIHVLHVTATFFGHWHGLLFLFHGDVAKNPMMFFSFSKGLLRISSGGGWQVRLRWDAYFWGYNTASRWDHEGRKPSETTATPMGMQLYVTKTLFPRRSLNSLARLHHRLQPSWPSIISLNTFFEAGSSSLWKLPLVMFFTYILTKVSARSLPIRVLLNGVTGSRTYPIRPKCSWFTLEKVIAGQPIGFKNYQAMSCAWL